MAARLSEEQSLLEKTLWIISSIVRVEQIQVALTWITLHRKRLETLYKKSDVDLPEEVYRRLDNKIREYGGRSGQSSEQFSKKNKLDANRISNHYRLRDKIENWEKRKKAGALGNKKETKA